MAASSDSSITNPSPLSSIAINDNDSPRSPKFHGNSKNNSTNLSSPWSQIVRGDYEPMNEGPRSSIDHDVKKDLPDTLAEISDGKSKKSAWNKPSNGVVEVGPVMGALSWPALADSAKTSSKSSCDPAKTTSNGVSFANQASGIVGSPRKPVMNNSNPVLNRQRSIKRNPGSSNGGNVAADVVQSIFEKPVTHSSNSSPRDNQHKNNQWNEQTRNNSFRKGSGGLHPNNFANRRDMERSNHEWSSPRSFNGRDVHVQPPRAISRNFPRQPIASPPFINTHTITPLGATMIFPDMVSPVYYVAAPDSLRGAAPFVAHPVPSSLYFAPPPPDPQLPSLIAKQIEYYFSVDNLCKDTYLRGQMDERGWVPISLIASFNRVKQYTNNIPFILDLVRGSNVVEVQGNKIRRRNDWMNWVLFQTNQIQSNAGHNSQTESNSEILANHFESARLENQLSIQYGTSGGAGDHPTEPVHNRSSSGEVLRSNKTFPAAISGEISSPVVLELSPSVRNLDQTD